jgi:hypothetical protein
MGDPPATCFKAADEGLDHAAQAGLSTLAVRVTGTMAN